MDNENEHSFQRRAMGESLPSSTSELIAWARRWTYQMGVPLDLLRELARRLEDAQKSPPLDFIVTREGKLGVGYSNTGEEGGFTTLEWASDKTLKAVLEHAESDGLIRIHPAHWSALYTLQYAAIAWDVDTVSNEDPAQVANAITKLRAAVADLRIVKGILDIPQSLLGIDREKLLERCGLRHLPVKKPESLLREPQKVKDYDPTKPVPRGRGLPPSFA